MCDALLAACLHVPADLEGVTGDVADLDVLRNGELLHLRDAAILGFTSCRDETVSVYAFKSDYKPYSQHNFRFLS